MSASKAAEEDEATMTDNARSYGHLLPEDLCRLGKIARQDREEFLNRCPRYRPLQDEIIAVALCQGAALHYVNGSNGIKDLDVWTFYAKRPTLIRYPRRGPSPRDFGDPRFGQSPDYPRYVSRKVDCFGCSIAFGDDRDPISALRSYLSDQRTPNARELARKAVVLIEPDALLGKVVWPA